MAGTIKHEWNGTVLTITSDSGTSSCNLKGEKGDDGARGAQGAPGDCVATDTAMLGGVAASEYATKAYVNDIVTDGIDLSEYATKEYTDTAVSKAHKTAYNYLDNSYFINPVNQRGQTTYTTAGYDIDRWRHGNSNLTVNVGNGITLTNNGTSGLAFQQLLDSDLAGKTITVAVCHANGAISCGSGTVTADAVTKDTSQVTVQFADKTGSVALYKTTTGIYSFRLYTATGKTVSLRWAALYEGVYTTETLPQYIYKGYAAELLECMRYCQKISLALTYRSSITSANTVQTLIPISVPMRVKPSIESGEFIVQTMSAANQTGFTFTIGYAGCNAMRIDGAKTSHGLTDAVLRVNDNVILSADL